MDVVCSDKLKADKIGDLMRWLVTLLLISFSTKVAALDFEFEGKTFAFELPDQLCQAYEGPVFDHVMKSQMIVEATTIVAVAEPCDLPYWVYEFAQFSIHNELRNVTQLEVSLWMQEFVTDQFWQTKNKQAVNQNFDKEIDGWELFSKSENHFTMVSNGKNWKIYTTLIAIGGRALYAALFLSSSNFTETEIKTKVETFVDSISQNWVVEDTEID